MDLIEKAHDLNELNWSISVFDFLFWFWVLSQVLRAYSDSGITTCGAQIIYATCNQT